MLRGGTCNFYCACARTHTRVSTTVFPLRPVVRLRVCLLGRIVEMEKWMSPFERYSAGRSEGRHTAFWDISQPPTQQLCCIPNSLRECFCWGKQHLELWWCCTPCFLYCGCLFVCVLVRTPTSIFLCVSDCALYLQAVKLEVWVGSALKSLVGGQYTDIYHLS